MYDAPPPSESRPVVEVFHGQQIADPFRWLEDSDSPETFAWVEAQNRYTRSVLDALPNRDQIRTQLEELFSIGFTGAPQERQGRLFFIRREAHENQPRLLIKSIATGEEGVVVDPNSLDDQGTTALDWWYPSWDGAYVAYGLSTSGDEQSTMRVFDCERAVDLPDTIPFTRFSTVAWLPDSSGFYYTAVVKSAPDPGAISSYYRRAVYLHRRGSDHMADEEVFPEDGDPETQPAVRISPDGKLLIVWVHKGWDRSWVYVRRSADTGWIHITEGLEGLFVPIPANDRLYMHTNYQAPRFRVLAVDPNLPYFDEWREIVPEREDATISEVVPVGTEHLALSYLRNAHSLLSIAPIDPALPAKDVPIAGFATIAGLSCGPGSDDVYFTVESFTRPPEACRYSLSAQRLEPWHEPPSEQPLDRILPDDVEVRQVWYPSHDGTQVSMFVMHKKGLALDGDCPTLLTGYGGFNVSRVPVFDRSWIVWVRLGGLVALSNLRGGGEYGEEWHRAGMLDRKQNVFDDFVAAAEYLIGQGFTSPEGLVIAGGSNGGLLVGAAMTQRPDLFRAVICAVPLLDMLRYQHFLIAKLWIPEYGSAEDADQFTFIHAYSPYHHVSRDAEYPAVMFMTGASDGRVDPMHARKMAALMQTSARARGPLLLRVEFEAGHGQGKPVHKVIDQLVDQLSFGASQVGLVT